jgi:molecular chaperone DnaJ
MWLQLRNQGELGELGAPRGNLKIQIVVKKHSIFDRRHNDLYCKVAVSQTAMTAGAEIQVSTVGKSYPLRIPKGTVEGDVFRMPGLGMPDIGGSFRGDLLVEVVLEPVEE